jgi:hypothetical protein
LQATEYLNPADEKPSKFISDQDVPNRFSMSGFFEFPFGKGKLFFSGANKLADAVIGGWQIEGTYTYQSGFPVNFTNDAFYLGGKISLPKSEQTLKRWFNTSAFLTVAPVDHYRTFPLRFSDVRIDAINNADLGLRKDIHLREQMKIQLRMEFINAFNHPLFPGPAVNPGSPSTFGQIPTLNQLNYARRAQLLAKFIF